MTHCGIYSLHDYKHAHIEAEKIGGLNLVVIPKRQYGPNTVAYNFTTHVKVRQFIHEKDEFDDLFRSSKMFSQVHHLEKIKLELEKMDQFIQYRMQNYFTGPIKYSINH